VPAYPSPPVLRPAAAPPPLASALTLANAEQTGGTIRSCRLVCSPLSSLAGYLPLWWLSPHLAIRRAG